MEVISSLSNLESKDCWILSNANKIDDPLKVLAELKLAFVRCQHQGGANFFCGADGRVRALIFPISRLNV